MSGKQVRVAGALLVVATLTSACSSSSPRVARTSSTTSSTTATTTGPPVSAASVTAFLRGEGAPLVRFEQATAALATGSAPDRATCLHLRDDVLPGISRAPDDLVAMTARIPDPALAKVFHTVVSLKVITVLGCATGSAATGRRDPKAFTSIRAFADDLHARLERIGITI